MCDHCHQPSRRTVLKAAAFSAAAALTGCRTREEQALDDYMDHLTANQGGAVRIDESKIVIPPPTPPTQTDYGSILPRAAWTSAPLTLRKGIAMQGVTRLTIHHSGDGKAFTSTATSNIIRHLQIVQQAHLQRGMIDIAYHFAIDPAGRAWQLRWLEYEGQHVRPSANGTPNNPHNVGVVVLGDFNLQKPPPAQTDRLFALVRLVRGKYRLSPSAVAMHGELVTTDCPGKYLEPVIRDARRTAQL